MNLAVEIVPDIVEAIILLVIFESLANQKSYIKENTFKAILFIAIYIISSYWSNATVPMVYHSLFMVIITILLLSYFTNINIFTAIIIYLLFFTIILLTEMLVATVEMFAFKINLDQIKLHFNYLIVLILVSKFLQICITYILFKFNSVFTKVKLLGKEGSLFSDYIIQTGIFGFFVLSVNFGVFNIKNMVTYNIFIFIIYFIFIIVGLIDLRERERIIEINNNYKVQEQQLKNMENIINIIREEKHDFANHINVIQALCFLDKPNAVEKIKEYVLKITDSLNSSFRYLDTGNDYLDGLLSIKNNFASKNDILFEVSINAYFNLLKIRENELISIISNIIDNAFEALKDKQGNKEIAFTSFLEEDKFCIEIANNGGEIPENIRDKIFEKGFSTKTMKKDEHGYGLYITKQLVESNNGSIYLESDEEETSFLIKFKIDKEK